VSPTLTQCPNPDFRTLKTMEYLNHVVCVIAYLNPYYAQRSLSLRRMESLRVYPPVPMTLRKAAKSDYVDGVWVPKGTFFCIGVYKYQLYASLFHITLLTDTGYKYMQRILGRRCRGVSDEPYANNTTCQAVTLDSDPRGGLSWRKLRHITLLILSRRSLTVRTIALVKRWPLRR
jgi:hypothetical protein